MSRQLLNRRNLLRTGIGVAIAALAIGFVFWRFITRPIYGLIASTMLQTCVAEYFVSIKCIGIGL